MELFSDEESALREAMRAYLQPVFTGNTAPPGTSRDTELQPRRNSTFKMNSELSSATKIEAEKYLSRTEILLNHCNLLERRLQDGWLRDENEALEAQVLQMQ